VVNWKRLGILAGILVALSGGLVTFLQHKENARAEEARRAASRLPVQRPTAPPPRPWRWATEGEWVVHEVVRGLASWSPLPGADPAITRISARRVASSPDPGTFEVQLESGQGSRKVEVRPATHVWDPSAYVAVARELIANTAERTTGPRVAALDELLLESDTPSLRRADRLLSVALLRRPHDADLHDQAALLWAAHALREADGDYADDRPFLNGITTHLALAAALGDGGHTTDGDIAASALDALLYRQIEAMATLDRLTASRPGRPAEAWASALRFRTTSDPRRVRPDVRFSRLEKIQALRSLNRARSCRAATGQARVWRLTAAPEWLRGVLPSCAEPERSELAARYGDLQTADALQMVDLPSDSLERALPALERLSAANTHAPTRPTFVLPEYVRADAGFRYLSSSVSLIVRALQRQGRPDAVRALSLGVSGLTANMPQRPLIELTLDRASEMLGNPGRKPPQAVCDRLARLIADRPDLVPAAEWPPAADCASANLLSMAGGPDVWRTGGFVAGTARMVGGPWQTGRAGAGDALTEAARHAPWIPLLAQYVVARHSGNAPGAVVTKAYGILLDYDLWAMQAAIVEIHDDDDTVQRLAERICEGDGDLCARYADYLYDLGRDDAAEKMWKRALAGARDSITLSNNLRGYVNLLLDRGDVREALRIAKRAADVYSAVGLATLALARERLGEYDEAARLYAAISERYESMTRENRFYLRYRQRRGNDRFADKARRAEAEVFPHGLIRRSLDDFRREGHRGSVPLGARSTTVALRRLGARQEDLLVAFDGYAVGSWDQMYAVESFSDAQTATAVVFRKETAPDGQGPPTWGFVSLSGTYPRWKYGSLPIGPAERARPR